MREYSMGQAEFVERLKNAKDDEEARLLIAEVYPYSTESTDDFYTKSRIEGLGWDSFYAVVEAEKKFGLGHFSSSYIATSLSYPKLSKMYAGIAANCLQDKGDFCQMVLINIQTNIIPRWDKSKNDNFFAFLMPHFQTSYNSMLQGDDGPSKYLKKKKGLSKTSIDAINERTNGGFDLKSEESVEDTVIDKIRHEDRNLLHRIINLPKDGSVNSENIWSSIFCNKLFNTGDDEIAIVDDIRISRVVELYFDAIDSGKIKSKYSQKEKENEGERFA